MKRSLIPVFCLSVGLLVIGCGPLAMATPTPVPVEPATSTPAPTATLPPTPTLVPTRVPLTAEMLNNAEYRLPQYNRNVKLKEGVYEAGQGADYISATLYKTIAWGDLNGDGVDDAAVLLAENGGGSGVFVSVVAMLNQDGQPFQAGAAMIDDRPQVNSLAIHNGQIVVGAIIHGTNDPGCCPAWPVTETYQLTGPALTLVRFASQNPDGTERAIHLESPTPGAQVSGALQIKGSATFAPFENSLVYRLVDVNGRELDQGPVMVASPEVGGHNTFDVSIDLDRSKFPAGSTFRLEVFDTSAVDGATLALDSADIVIK